MDGLHHKQLVMQTKVLLAMGVDPRAHRASSEDNTDEFLPPLLIDGVVSE